MGTTTFIDSSILQDIMEKMETVQNYTHTLDQLATRWDLLSLLGQMSGTGTDMSHTRKALSDLSRDLLENLAKESLNKALNEISAKAQVTVDILIRNLFERTADIGFLSTDDQIRKFFKPGSAKLTGHEMLERFSEYVAKYSVYDNIILTDCEGRIILQLDDTNLATRSFSPIIAEALTTSKEYVEFLGKSDLQPTKPLSLLYAFRVSDGDKPLGVLILSFKFDDEMERIYKKLLSHDDWLVLTILDHQGCVITSSDPYQIPIGATFQPQIDEEFSILKFAGRLYLTIARPTKGYQGYMGLGWIAQAMIPLDYAFRQQATTLEIDNELIAAATTNKALFSDALRSIPQQASQIQKELDMTVWNGTVRQRSGSAVSNGSFAKSLLWEVSNTGEKTKDVFESSIKNLQETVISAIVNNSVSLASLGSDIMDRNLYERANDCRWWALTPAFQSALCEDRPLQIDETAQLTQILSYINNLYTVYTNLILFDRHGRIVAVSQPSYNNLIGRPLYDSWVKETLLQTTTQSYVVSDFSPTPLYDTKPTYIYSAPIFASKESRHAVGGVAIVFDSEPQFLSMLEDVLPHDESSSGAFAAFVEAKGTIIASTNETLTAHATSLILTKASTLKNGETLADIVSLMGVYYAMGLTVSSGYREYKSQGTAYQNDVVSAVFVPLGQTNSEVTQIRNPLHTSSDHRFDNGTGARLEVGTFFIGDRWFGFETHFLVEAISPKAITTLPGIDPIIVGRVLYHNRTIDVLDIRKEVGVHSCCLSGDAQVIIVRAQTDPSIQHPVMFGILVDDLGPIPEVNEDQIESIEGLLGSLDILGSKIVRPDNTTLLAGEQMLVILEPDRIIDKLKKRR